MRALELNPNASPKEWGEEHGETFRPLINEIANIRLELCRTIGGFKDDASLLALAESHLTVAKEFDGHLSDELQGIARGAKLSIGHIVLLNHYTDLRDLGPAFSGDADHCSAVYALASEEPLLAQTWDMHGSAEPYILMLKSPERDGRPASWTFTITGCLGMTGMNDRGVGVTINNLRSTDARVGIVWPALVRKMLAQSNAVQANQCLQDAPVGSGHHYLLADEDNVFGVETSGTEKRIVYQGDTDSYVHTNHCLDSEIHQLSAESPTSTTHERYKTLVEGISARPVQNSEDLWKRLGDHENYPRSVCTHLSSPKTPHAVKTCGGILMRPKEKALWAAEGCLHHTRPTRFSF